MREFLSILVHSSPFYSIPVQSSPVQSSPVQTSTDCIQPSKIETFIYGYRCTVDCLLLFLSVESGCSHGDVRLMDGGSELEGRVEICWNRVWGAVAKAYGRWTFQEAKIICTQLGYSSECEYCH